MVTQSGTTTWAIWTSKARLHPPPSDQYLVSLQPIVLHVHLSILYLPFCYECNHLIRFLHVHLSIHYLPFCYECNHLIRFLHVHLSIHYLPFCYECNHLIRLLPVGEERRHHKIESDAFGDYRQNLQRILSKGTVV